MRKILLISLILIVSAVGIYGWYLYNKKPVDTHEQQPDYEISAAALVKEFNVDDKLATSKYADKIVLVSGIVKEVDRSSLTVFLGNDDRSEIVNCSFYATDSSQFNQIHLGDHVSVKGKCTGMLIDVVLNNCTLMNVAKD